MSEQVPAIREETPEGLVATWDPFTDIAEFAVQTSLPCETLEERRAVIALKNAEWVKGITMMNKEFEISDYLCHPVLLTNEETGEQSPGVRMVFPQPSGKPIAFVSLGVLKALGELGFVTNRNPPWHPPIRVRLIQAPGSGKRLWYQLEYVSG